jgi:hypothetical protein
VEHLDGRLELLYWNDERTRTVPVHGQQEFAA